MAITVVRINKNFDPIKFYGHISNEEITQIRKIANVNNFKCVKYLDSHENTFFNQKQIGELLNELNNTESEHFLSAVQVINQAIKEIQSPDEFLAFWGD